MPSRPQHDVFDTAQTFQTSVDPSSLPKTGPGFEGKRYNSDKEYLDINIDETDSLTVEEAGQEIPPDSRPLIKDLVAKVYKYIKRTE